MNPASITVNKEIVEKPIQEKPEESLKPPSSALKSRQLQVYNNEHSVKTLPLKRQDSKISKESTQTNEFVIQKVEDITTSQIEQIRNIANDLNRDI